MGFTAQGIGEGRPYDRQPGSFDERGSWIFEGIGDDELIGDFPSLVNAYGAAGFEVDRVDHALGSRTEPSFWRRRRTSRTPTST